MDSALTVEQRVLLHLLANPLHESKWDAPTALTQAGISAAVDIKRKHLPRTLRRLVDNEKVEQRKRHVPNTRQRCLVYTLSTVGRERAQSLHDKVAAGRVEYQGEDVSILELCNHERPLLDVLRAIDTGVFDATRLTSDSTETEGEESVEDSEIPSGGTVLLRKLFETALSDGVITVDERAMIDSMSRTLAVDGDVVKAIEDEVESNISPPGSAARIYQCMLGAALADGQIDGSEQAMLDSLAASLDLSARQLEALREEWMATRLPFEERVFLGALCAVHGKGEDVDLNVISTIRKALSIDNETEERLVILADSIYPKKTSV